MNPAPLPRTDPRPGFTPDNHPARDVKPDDWMLRNLRQTMENIAPLYAGIDLERKESSNGKS